MNLIATSSEFYTAVITAETTWDMLKIDRENRKRLARYIRALRRCDRLRSELKTLMETGKL